MFFNFLFEDELHTAQLVIKQDNDEKKMYVFLVDNLLQRFNDSFRFTFSNSEGLKYVPYRKQNAEDTLVLGLQRALQEKIN